MVAGKVNLSTVRNVKVFLYPPQETFLLLHCWQIGCVSSHFNRFSLQVMHPDYPTSARFEEWIVDLPSRLFVCLGFGVSGVFCTWRVFACFFLATAFFFNGFFLVLVFDSELGGLIVGLLSRNIEGDGKSTSAMHHGMRAG